MVLAITGNGINRTSGIPAFRRNPELFDKLSCSFAQAHPEEFQKTISEMQTVCERAEPSPAHLALAEYDVPIITLNADGLHQRAGSKHVLELYGHVPDIILYGDQAPNYTTAFEWIGRLREGDVLLMVGTSCYDGIADTLKCLAMDQGVIASVINRDLEHTVCAALETYQTYMGDFEEFLRQAPIV